MSVKHKIILTYTKDLSVVEFISTSEMGDCIIQKIEELYND